MKKFLKLALAGSLLAGFFPQGAQAQTTIDREEGVVIGFDETFAPFGFLNDEGVHVGFDIDLAEEILGRMEVDYELQPIEWSLKETELNTGNIDMIWNGYSITPERQEVVAFSDPYIDNRQVIIVKADSDIETKADLAGRMIATQAQSASLEAVLKDEEFVNSLAEEPITYETFVEVFQDLDNGRVDAIVIDETMASYYLEQRGDADNYRYLDENFGEEKYAVGFRKDDVEFIEEFNQVLAEIQEDGTFNEIRGRWFADVDGEDEAVDSEADEDSEENEEAEEETSAA